MKKVILSIAAAVTLTFAAFSANAQAQKIGHINSTEILTLMPEAKVADGDLQKFGQSLESQLKTMSGELQAKYEEYQSKRELMADAIKQTKEKELQDLQSRIQEFQQTAQESMQKKKEELYSPILKKVQETINEIAKENGYTYVLDASTGVILFSSEGGNDLGPLVKKKLNLPLTAPVAGAAGTDAPSGMPVKRPAGRK